MFAGFYKKQCFVFQAQLEQADQILSSDTALDRPSSLSLLVILLKAQYCYSTGQVGNIC